MLVGFGVLLGILSSWWFLAAAFAVLAVKGLIEGHELEHPPTWERHGRVMVRTPASRPPNVRPPSSPTGLQRAAKLWTKREIETIGAELDGEP